MGNGKNAREREEKNPDKTVVMLISVDRAAMSMRARETLMDVNGH